MAALKKNVVIAHFQGILSSPSVTSDPEAFDFIDLIISTLNSDLHPADVFNEHGIQRIRDITKIDVTTLNISGIERKGSTASIKFDIDSVESSCTSCVYFSCAENLSVHYKYANPVNIPTCSHPESPYGIYCNSGAVHVNCSHYLADSYHYADFTVKDETATYSVDYERTTMGSIKFTIKDSNQNLLNELSYFADFYSKIEKEAFDFELKNIIEQIHSNTTAKDETVISSFVQQKSQESKSKVSYLNYLTTA